VCATPGAARPERGPIRNEGGWVLDVAKQAVEAAKAAGADYADGRVVADTTESLTVRNQEMEGIDRSESQGIGVRVLVDGYWGFAATARLDAGDIDRTASLAVEIARAASRLPMEPVKLAPVEPQTGTWHSPMQEDPFNVPLEEKVALLMEATRRMQSVQGLAFAEGGIDLFRRRTWLATSEGTAVEQTTVQSGAGIEAVAIGDGEMQRRSFPNSFRGHVSAAGWEHVEKLHLIEEAERTATEAVELLTAKECPSEVTTLVLDSGQMELQIHESIGHPVELDRVLGMEEAYAGSSFVKTDDRNSLRYASDLVSITADASLPGGLGSFGWDDEGVPAGRTPIIVDGIFRDFISSRETASVLGLPSSGAMRADGWQHLPLIRMTNISIEPRHHRRHRRRHLHDHEHVVVDRRPPHQLPVRLRDRVAHPGRQAHRDVPEPELHGDHARVLAELRRGRRPRGLDALGNAELREGATRSGGSRRPRRDAGAVPRRADRRARLMGAR